jgi:hypothetical protein
MRAHLLVCARNNQWPFPGAASDATYGQLLLLLRAQSDDSDNKRPMPRRMWADWMARLGHGPD